MSLNRRPAWAALAACLALLALSNVGCGLLRRPPPAVVIVYTRGLSGFMDAADVPPAAPTPPATLAQVAAAVQPLREAAQKPGDVVALFDLGDSLSGSGALNAARDGRPMAAAFGAVGYDAVLPAERDLWRTAAQLQATARLGKFPFLITNARGDHSLPEAWGRPCIRSVAGLRVAVFGVYVSPHDAAVEPGAVTASFACSPHLEVLRQAMREAGADANVVLASVTDVVSLAEQLPEATVVIPAGSDALQPMADATASPLPHSAASPAASRVAPALATARSFGTVRLQRDRDGRLAVRCEVHPLPDAASAPEPLAAAVAGFRREVANGFAASWHTTASQMRAWSAAPTDAPEQAADLVREELACDVCLLGKDDVRGHWPARISDAALGDGLSAGARMGVASVDGRQAEAWLKNAGGQSGLVTWKTKDGALHAFLHGQPLAQIPRLKAAVPAAWLSPTPGRPLGEIVRDALATHPILSNPPRRAFVVQGAEVPSTAWLLDKGRQLASNDHAKKAREAWLQAVCRQPDEAVTRQLLDAIQTSDPSSPPSYREVGRMHEDAGNWRLAWAAYEMGRTAYPDAWIFPLAQARVLLRAGLPLAVAAPLQEARAHGAPPEEVGYLEALAALTVGDAARARSLVEERHAIPAPDVATRAVGALALLGAGELDHAAAAWKSLPAADAPPKRAPLAGSGAGGADVEKNHP